MLQRENEENIDSARCRKCFTFFCSGRGDEGKGTEKNGKIFVSRKCEGWYFDAVNKGHRFFTFDVARTTDCVRDR